MKIEHIVNLYNKLFPFAILLGVIFLVCRGIYLYYLMNVENDKKWYSFRLICKQEIERMLMFVIGVFLFDFLISGAFSIKVSNYLDIHKYWKIAIGLLIIIRFRSAKILYRELNYQDFLRRVTSGENNYTTPENIFLNMIEVYNINIEMKNEKMEILKSLTPISLLPLIVGWMLEGKNVEIDWNWCTVAIVAILVIYLYNVWKCYYDMRFWKLRKIEIQRELREHSTEEKDEEKS